MKVLQTAMLRRDSWVITAWLVVFAWLAGSAAAFWYFELSDWRPFSNSQARITPTLDIPLVEQWFRSAVRSPSSARSRSITFIHLYNPACRCNRFTDAHLQRLRLAFEGQGVRFMLAAAAVGDSPKALGLETISTGIALLHAAGIDSAPSALIFDAAGRLIYYGPYSNAAWCGSAGALVDPVLKRALSESARFTGVPAVRGCFCEW